MTHTIGILGGMGPLATLDFAHKILAATAARCDQDHLPLLIHSVPQIPDRSACLMAGAPSPLPALREGLQTLVSAGAGCVVMPCNTAHHWHRQLAADSPVEILHIARIGADRLALEGIGEVALLATDGTLKAGFYPEELAARGIRCQEPDSALQKQVMTGIYRVKAGQLPEGAALLQQAVRTLLDRGAERVILGCTEIPLALDSLNSEFRQHCLDATAALATGCIDWYRRSSSQMS